MNGAFGQWKSWSKCSKKCGGGIKIRKRNCDKPKPKHGGKKCHGKKVQKAKCNVKPCPGKHIFVSS